VTEAARSRTTIQPGALTALLGELAQAPDATGWAVPAVPGETIGRFEILREIGRGGFGVVYEARDTELGRSVAFKAIRVGSSDAVREQRALAEAAARLAHPNIVHLYDLGRCDRGAFLILELLRGESHSSPRSRGRWMEGEPGSPGRWPHSSASPSCPRARRFARRRDALRVLVTHVTFSSQRPPNIRGACEREETRR
jgi:Protein kinase domain